MTEKLDEFMKVYEGSLKEAVERYPEKYVYPVADVPVVAGRMREAILMGSYSHNSEALKLTAKKLGIKHSRKAIEAYIGLERKLKA